MARKTYGSDLTDKQWKLIEPHIPPEKDFGRPRTTDMREVTNALLYMLRTGCQWDMLPEGFPPKSTVNGYFNAWKRDGTLDEILRVLREYEESAEAWIKLAFINLMIHRLQPG